MFEERILVRIREELPDVDEKIIEKEIYKIRLRIPLDNDIELKECERCGWCCNNLHVPCKKEELEDIALYMSKDICHDKSQIGTFLTAPCLFFRDNACDIYKLRPSNCKDFPISKTREGDFIVTWEQCPLVVEYGVEYVVKKIEGKNEISAPD